MGEEALRASRRVKKALVSLLQERYRRGFYFRDPPLTPYVLEFASRYLGQCIAWTIGHRSLPHAVLNSGTVRWTHVRLSETPILPGMKTYMVHRGC
jgi:hypothetical protein